MLSELASSPVYLEVQRAAEDREGETEEECRKPATQ